MLAAAMSTEPTSNPILVPPAEAAKMLTKSSPVIYPPEAKQRKLNGKVLLQATIGPDGAVIDVKAIETSDLIFVDPAIAAVRNWQYKPYYVKGSPVTVNVMVTVNFRYKK
jgi:TonB family protein